ncbi:MAG: hypothetical protein IT372_17660 [Polyangiaceae bacterium]|nr:hypothetical protein [Polyangiaceae bacterium]
MRFYPSALVVAPFLFLLACGGDDSAGGGGTSQTTTSGAGGSGGAPAPLFPLAVGLRWTYDVAQVGAGSACAAGQHQAEVVGSGTLAGKQSFNMTTWCAGGGDAGQYAPGAGDEVFFFYMAEWLTLLSTPVEEGHTWDYVNTSFTWHDAGSVTVPAGTYDDCWTMTQNVEYTAYTTYCRGVGAVRSYS